MSLLRLGCKKTVFSVFTALWLSLSLSFRSPAAKVDLKGVLPTQSQSILGLEGSVLELMPYSDHLEKYWIIFELGNLHLHLALGLTHQLFLPEAMLWGYSSSHIEADMVENPNLPANMSSLEADPAASVEPWDEWQFDCNLMRDLEPEVWQVWGDL